MPLFPCNDVLAMNNENDLKIGKKKSITLQELYRKSNLSSGKTRHMTFKKQRTYTNVTCKRKAQSTED